MMSKKRSLNRGMVAALIVVFLVLILSYRLFDLGPHFSLENLKEKQFFLQIYYQENSVLVATLFALVYIVSTAISLPGATVLTLAAGTIFGLGLGTLLVSVCSTIGATLAFLAARFLVRGFVQSKFGDKIERINRGIQEEGAYYLFTLRLVPLFPFFLINLVMGLTPMKTGVFFIVSQLGMLPGTLVYVNAGTQLAKIDSLRAVLSPTLLASFAFIGILPLLSKRILLALKRRQALSRFVHPKTIDYNMVVIGGGSAGLVSSFIAATVKARVALIEKHKMGGDCLNTGCVPSKALIRSAKILNYFKRSREFGFEELSAKWNFADVMERVKSVVSQVEPHDSVERYTSLGVECLQGEAKIRSPYEVEVGGRVLSTRNIVIATGASPFVPPIPGLGEVSFLTSDNVWELKELPQRLVVLGGGPIGCELAQCFARFGSQVDLVEMAPRILMREDQEVSSFVTDTFKKEGVSVLTSRKALRVLGDRKILVCEFKGREVEIAFDEILLALGRRANVKGFGLEELGVEIAPHGTIVADEYLRAKPFDNIYVCGDVTGPYQFTHTASHQAWYAAVNSLFSPFKKYRVDYRVIPWCTFTDPEVARVGLNEQEAREKGIDYQVSHYGIDDLDRAIADSEARGFVKILTPPKSDRILGVTIVGVHAGDIIAEYVAAMKHGLGVNKIMSTIHIYPTLAEANKYAAGSWKRANAPVKLLELVERFHAWRRK